MISSQKQLIRRFAKATLQLRNRIDVSGPLGALLASFRSTLLPEDLVALSETIRTMKEIDEVIEEHGGWPGAFTLGAPATRL